MTSGATKRNAGEMETAMSENTTFVLGSAQVTLLNAGDMRVRLADEYAVPEEVWRQGYADLFD